MNKINLSLPLKHASFLLQAVEQRINSFKQELDSKDISEDRTAELQNDLMLLQGIEKEIKDEITKNS